MATYCFKERRHALFAEVAAHALLAVARDFPRFVPYAECVERATEVCDALQSETCCIKRDVGLYRQMVQSCYVSLYESQKSASEREMVTSYGFLKGIPDDEVALKIVRIGLEGAECRRMIDAAYAQFFR